LEHSAEASSFFARLRTESEPILALVADLGTDILSTYDLREYATPIQDPDVINFNMNADIFSYEPFFHEYNIPVPPKYVKTITLNPNLEDTSS
jgi:hypothetical protein